jgi:uncharacterized protein (TIGR03118 family)
LCRPTLEGLEDRCLLATGFVQTNLVSDIPGLAAHTDSHLVNSWGLAVNPNPTTGFMWVADNGTGVSTLYDGMGNMNTLVVTVPPPASDPTATSAPTGVVFNGDSAHYMVTANGKTGSAAFLFATEDGTISGWSPTVDLTHAILGADNSGSDAVYKGLALGTSSQGAMIYAANFRSGRIDVFNDSFQPRSVAGGFRDPTIPAGYAPFDIRNIGGKLFVTYAKQDADKHDDVAGAGHGFIDVFDTNGHLLQRLVSRGRLNSPWGLAVAPSNFGTFSGALLVGNFGDGRINAYNINTGAFLGTLKDAVNGRDILIPGLWGLEFGNGGLTGATNTLFFGAGIFGEAHGLFGDLTAVTVPSLIRGAAGSPQGLAAALLQGLLSSPAGAGAQAAAGNGQSFSLTDFARIDDGTGLPGQDSGKLAAASTGGTGHAKSQLDALESNLSALDHLFGQELPF